MVCPKCKADQSDNAQFCSQCSQPLTEHGKAIARSSNATWAWVVVVLSLFVGLAAFAFWRVTQDVDRKANAPIANTVSAVSTPPQVPDPPPSSEAQLPPPIVPQFHQVVIAKGAATIAAHSYSWYTFVVPPGAASIAVNGRFTATGGSGNDIICYILDDDGLVNFKNGHATRTFFNSGKMTQAGIGAVLAPGTFYLVLDNRYSLITPKAVEINATLSYVQ
jgi:hypothetical protein